MIPPPIRSFIAPSALAPATILLATGCQTSDSGAALGVGIAVLSVGAWAAYRRLTASNATPSAPPVVAPAVKTPSAADLTRTLVQKRYPILGESVYRSLLDTVVARTAAAMGTIWNPTLADGLVEEQIRGLILDLRKIKHSHLTERLWQELDPHYRLFDDLTHSNPEIVQAALRKTMKTAYYQEALPLPSYLLVTLRRLLSGQVPEALAMDSLLTLEAIAAPSRRPYVWDQQLAETALSILIHDGLSHKNASLAFQARAAFRRIEQRRPEIVTEEMREFLKTR